MNTKQQVNLDALLQEIGQEQNNFKFDKEKLELEVNQNASGMTDLPLKLLTIFGSLLATLFFMGFLYLIKLFESPEGMLVFGGIFMVCSGIISRNMKSIMAETTCVAFGIIGCILFSIGFDEFGAGDYALCGALAVVGLAAISFTQNNLFVFLGTLLLNGSLITLTILPDDKNLLHLYTGLAAGLLTYLSLHEAKLITYPTLNRLYLPVWLGLALSLLAAVFLLTHRHLGFEGIRFVWVSSVLLFGMVLLVLLKVLDTAGIHRPVHRLLICLGCFVILAPTVLTPSLAGALLVLLLSFYLGERTGEAMGIVALLYFVSRFYYDLQLTLLQKSGVLVLTGVLFILGYLLLHKYLTRHAS